MNPISDDDLQRMCARINANMVGACAIVDEIKALWDGPDTDNRRERIHALSTDVIGLVDDVLNEPVPIEMKNSREFQCALETFATLRRITVDVQQKTR